MSSSILKMSITGGLLCFASIAYADPPINALSVANCGTVANTPVAGNPYPVTMDLTGKLCTSSTGGGGGGNVTITAPLGVQTAAASVATTVNGTVTITGTVANSGTVPVSGTVSVSGTVPVSGTITSTPSGTTTVAGTVTATGTLAATQSGSWSVQPIPQATGGAGVLCNLALKATATACDASAGTATDIVINNIQNTVEEDVQLYAVAQGSVTVGTTPVTKCLAVPPGAVIAFPLGGFSGLSFANAITVAVTTGTASACSGTTAPTNNVGVTIDGK